MPGRGLGHWAIRHPRLVVLAWVLLCVLGAWQAGQLRNRLQGEMGGVPGSMSERALASLSHDFDFPYAHLLLITLEATGGRDIGGSGGAAIEARKADLVARLKASDQVRAVREVPSDDPGLQAIAVGLTATTLGKAEQAVPVIRRLVADVVPPAGGVRALVTGQAALNTDAVRLGSEQASEAELRVMPIVLVALLVAFGSLGAAVAPLLTGAAAVLLAMGTLSVLAQWLHLSILAANVATMVGLSLGIDYALFVVSRIREEASALGASPGDTSPGDAGPGGPGLGDAGSGRAGTDGASLRVAGIDGASPGAAGILPASPGNAGGARRASPLAGAAHRAVTHTTPVILTSVGTVVIGFGALTFVPVPETVGMGLGGLVVASTSLLASLTLLPAIATLLGKWLDAPRFLSGRLVGAARTRRWEGRARWVVRRPWLSLGIACAVLGTLLLPLRQFELGFPGFSAAPRRLESVLALDAVVRLGIGGAMLPSQIVVRAPEGQSILGPARLKGQAAMVEWLRARPEVSQVHAIAGSDRTLKRLLAGVAIVGTADLARYLPREGQALLSKDRQATLIQVVPATRLSYGEVRAFNRLLRAQDWSRFQGLEGATVLVGGPTSVESDFIDLSRSILPWLALFIMGATFVSLFVLTRSIVIPLKAVVTNLLTVGATIGASTWLFRSEVGSRLLGMSEPVTTVQALFPVMIFCLLFGLSMDYETFLISRIQEAHRAGADDREAVVKGLGASGGIITSTALIMAIVFSGFAFCELVPVKLLGVTLAIGILLDATVTRLLLIPAAIVLLGRWNWFPAGDSARTTAKIRNFGQSL